MHVISNQVIYEYITTHFANPRVQPGKPFPDELEIIDTGARGNCMFSSVERNLSSEAVPGPTIREQRKCIGDNWTEARHTHHVMLAKSLQGRP